MSRALLAPGGDTRSDMVQVHEMLRYYALAHDLQMPTGINAEITRALQLPDDLGLRLIEPGHPAINDDGEIVDRWGSPYDFHAESPMRTTIRSAGPDCALHTSDDLVWPEPQKPAPPRQRGVVVLFSTDDSTR